MKNENKVLACVDRSRFADYVADYAAWAASRLNAPLELLHVIDPHPERSSGDDHSGAIGINAQENLLEHLSSEDEKRAKEAREQGRIFLNRLRGRVASSGAASVDMRQRHGGLEETLSEQQAGTRLIVLGRRGESADATQRDIGRNVERVVRALHKPILIVSDTFQAPRRAMIALDGGVAARRAVETLAASPLLHGLPIHILMSGKPDQKSLKQFEWAKSTLEAAQLSATAAVVPGDAESVIAQEILAQSIDLLVMGAYSHSSLHALFFGSRTTDILRSATIPTLLLR